MVAVKCTPFVPRDVPIDAHGRLDDDIHCLQCGYNLRGAGRDGACPECGSPVEASVRGDRLQFADPQWLATLTSGLKWMRVAGIFAIIYALLAPLFIHSTVGSAAGRTPFLALGTIIPGGLILLGVWEFTTADPRLVDSQSDDGGWIRHVVRIGVAVALSIAAGAMLGVRDPVIADVMETCGQAAGVVAGVALMVWVARLAARLPNPRIMHDARIVAWGLAIASGLLLTLSTADMVLRTSAAPSSIQPPAYVVAPPLQASQVVRTMLPDGTQRVTYPQNDPNSPNPEGITTVDANPDGGTRTYVAVAIGHRGTSTHDTYRGPNGGIHLTVGLIDPSGAAVYQSTMLSAAGPPSRPLALRFAVGLAALAWVIFVAWGVGLLVWFYRRLRFARSSRA